MRLQIRRTRCLDGARRPHSAQRYRCDLFADGLNLEPDKSLQLVVVPAWEDLTKVSEHGSVRFS